MNNPLVISSNPKIFHAPPTCFPLPKKKIFNSFLLRPCNPNFFLTRQPSTESKLNVISWSSKNSLSVAVESAQVGSNEKEAVLPQSDEGLSPQWNVQVGNPVLPPMASPLAKLTLSDKAFFLLLFIACTTAAAFTSLVIASIPTLQAMRRAAISLSRLADTAREELPSTMTAIRLSGMELSDLTLELSDLSQEITDGVNKSARAVQAAEAGIRQIGSIARQQTLSLIQERANLPKISLQPVVAGAARKTSSAVGRATKSLINFLSGGEWTNPENKHSEGGIERMEV